MNRSGRTRLRRLTSPGIWLSLAAVGSVSLGLHLNVLSRRARRAHELLSEIRLQSAEDRLVIEAAAKSMLETSQALFGVHRWFLVAGLAITLSTAFWNWASLRIRLITAAAITLLLFVMVFGQPIP